MKRSTGEAKILTIHKKKKTTDKQIFFTSLFLATLPQICSDSSLEMNGTTAVSEFDNAVVMSAARENP